MTTADAVDEIWAILQALPSPREAAMALAGAHVMLIEAEGVADEAGVRARLKESGEAVVDVWRDRMGLDITH